MVAAAAWNTADPNWTAMLSRADTHTRAGVLAWMQPTTDFTLGGPPLPSPLAWDSANQDLVMLPVIPEPGVVTLAGLAAVTLLIFQRRR